ncbi:MAG: macrophage infectivity potentiator Mip [Isosphaeraceae bacterium]
MKRSIAAVVGLGFTILSALAVGQDTPKKGDAPAQLKDLKARASYSLGLNLGRSLKSNGVDIDSEVLSRGLRDGLSGGKALMTDQEMQEVMQAFQQQIKSKQMETAKSAGEKNKKEGIAFLAANKAKPGVQTLPSGLQYKVIKEGTGKTPKATDTVSTHYRGTLLDGTEFDSSIKRGQPASFPVNQVIAGWTEALQKMKVGSKWQLFIPAELAYGASPPAGSPIGPNSVLVFDLELLGVQ